MKDRTLSLATGNHQSLYAASGPLYEKRWHKQSVQPLLNPLHVKVQHSAKVSFFRIHIRVKQQRILAFSP